MEKLITIVIPFYNRKRYVKIMLESVIMQTYQNWEALLIDDGSDDGTTTLVKDLTKKDSRIHYYDRSEYAKERGACAARNIGLQNAKGEYIIFFDSDDYISKDCLKHRVGFMENNPLLDFAVFPYYKYFDKEIINGKVVSGIKTGEDDLYNLYIRNLPFTVVSNIYRTESLRSNGIAWDVKLLSIQDADFNINVMTHNLKYEYCMEYGFDYYVRMNQSQPSVSKSILKPSHLESHLYYLSKRVNYVKSISDEKFVTALYFLSVSFYQLMFNSIDHKKKLFEVIKTCKKIKTNLILKDKIASFLCQLGLPSRYVFKMLFPTLSMAFRNSVKKRTLLAKEIYDISKEEIYKIEELIND